MAGRLGDGSGDRPRKGPVGHRNNNREKERQMAEEIEFEPIAVAPPDGRIASALEAMALAQIAQLKVLEEIKKAIQAKSG
jgi:predicted transcriptional regulator